MSRAKSEEAATLRLWHSSPIWSAWAGGCLRSRGPCAPMPRVRAAGGGGGGGVVDAGEGVEHRRPVRAEAQHLAEAFVLDGEGAIAARSVLYDEDGHGGRNNACHGSHRAEVVAGREARRAVVGEPLCRLRRGRPAFVEDGGDH